MDEKGAAMATATEERLGHMRRRIDRLELRARSGAADVRSRTQLRTHQLRDEQLATVISVHFHAAAAEETVEELATDVEMAEHRLAAELADDRDTFAAAVEAELNGWDAYLDRKQAKAAARTAPARERAESAVGDLRQRRIAVAESLADVRSAPADAWPNAKSSILGALGELRQQADAYRDEGRDDD
jgi:hypothetical protein